MSEQHAFLDAYPELEQTDFGDFVVRRELVKDYEIIDFHTHIFPAIVGMLPKPFRREVQDQRATFFKLSCYPGDIKFFDLEQVCYRTWPKSWFSRDGAQTAIDLLGLGGVIPLIQKATSKRLLRDMDLGSVAQAVVLPINAKDVECTRTLLECVANSDRLLVFGSIHPYENSIEEKIETYLSKGVKGFKVNPHVQEVNFDDEKMIRLIQLLAKTGLPVISCSGLALPGYVACQMPKSIQRNLETQNLNRYASVLSQVPEIPFIFGHGGLEQTEKLISLMIDFPWTYTDISTQPPINIKRLIDEVGGHRLLYGSDYPFFNQAIPILSVLKATDDIKTRKAIFAGNARTLLKLL